jgi:hypothetical protein
VQGESEGGGDGGGVVEREGESECGADGEGAELECGGAAAKVWELGYAADEDAQRGRVRREGAERLRSEEGGVNWVRRLAAERMRAWQDTTSAWSGEKVTVQRAVSPGSSWPSEGVTAR